MKRYKVIVDFDFEDEMEIESSDLVEAINGMVDNIPWDLLDLDDLSGYVMVYGEDCIDLTPHGGIR